MQPQSEPTFPVDQARHASPARVRIQAVSVVRSLDSIPAWFTCGAVAIGNFDGVHRGHQAMLAQFPGNHFVLVQAAKYYVIVRDYARAAALYDEDFRLFRTPQSRQLADQASRLAQGAR